MKIELVWISELNESSEPMNNLGEGTCGGEIGIALNKWIADC